MAQVISSLRLLQVHTIGNMLEAPQRAHIAEQIRIMYPASTSQDGASARIPIGAQAEKYNNGLLVDLLENAHADERREAVLRRIIETHDQRFRNAGINFYSLPQPGSLVNLNETDLGAYAATSGLNIEYLKARQEFDAIRSRNSQAFSIEHLFTYPEAVLKEVKPELANPEHVDHRDALRAIAKAAIQTLSPQELEFHSRKAKTFAEQHQPSIDNAKADLARLTAPRGFFGGIAHIWSSVFSGEYRKKQEYKANKIRQTELYIATMQERIKPMDIIADAFAQETTSRESAKQAASQETVPGRPLVLVRDETVVAKAGQSLELEAVRA